MDFNRRLFSGYIDIIWKECMDVTNKHLKVGELPKKKG